MVSSAFSTGTQTTWNIQIVDSASSDNSPVIQVDSQNNPHIAYSNYENGNYHLTQNLMYASWNGSSWDKQTVTTYPCSPLGLGFDTYNNPYILYRREGFGLIYASWNGSTWTSQKVDKGITGSIALDSLGNPHIAYIAEGNSQYSRLLKYATSNGSDWNLQTLQSSNDIIGYPNLALDKNGNPHIMYEKDNYESENIPPYQSSSVIQYAVWNNSLGWNYQTVLSNVTFVKMALDSNDYPHFTYFGGQFPGNRTLVYASWNGSAWSSEIVTSNADSGGDFMLDSNNQPYLDYFISTNLGWMGDLMYAKGTGNTWNTQTIDSNTATGPGRILIDSHGNPQICYPGPRPNGNLPPYSLMYAIGTEIEQTPSPTPNENLGVSLSSLIIIVVVIVAVLAAVTIFGKKRLKSERKVKTV